MRRNGRSLRRRRPHTARPRWNGAGLWAPASDGEGRNERVRGEAPVGEGHARRGPAGTEPGCGPRRVTAKEETNGFGGEAPVGEGHARRGPAGTEPGCGPRRVTAY